jgi:uncharacterized membrane protein
MPNVGPVEVIVVILIGLIFVGIVVLAAYAVTVLAVVLNRIVPSTGSPRDPALDTLRSRLARAEIDEAEYERLRFRPAGRLSGSTPASAMIGT